MLYEARNCALKKCKGEFVAFLDVDDWWTPSKLEKQISRFNNKNIGLVYCDSTIVENNLKYNHFSAVSPFMGKAGHRLLEANFMTTSSIIYRAETLKSLPIAFRDELSLTVDYELSVRVSFSCEIDYVNEPLVAILKHKKNHTNKHKKEIIKENAMVLKYFYKEKLHISCPNEILSFKKNCLLSETNMLLDSGVLVNGLKSLEKVKDFSKKYNALFVILSIFPSIKILSNPLDCIKLKYSMLCFIVSGLALYVSSMNLIFMLFNFFSIIKPLPITGFNLLIFFKTKLEFNLLYLNNAKLIIIFLII